ncbi:MAG TPA: GspH/FimT family pseudopilin [Pseudomonadota bacterium]|jgi:type IV fimbrial biogenesis protein FimT|nr:GspH/FimT family pseudopilin [Pseudomonadota bacterium]
MRIAFAPDVGSRRFRQAGVTLIELIVTLTIAAILVALATPSFQSVMNSSRVSNPANEMIATLQLARMEAFRRGERTVVCRSENADSASPSCTSASGDWGGWLAFVDIDANGAMGGTDVVLRATSVPAPTVVTPSDRISSASNNIVFRPDGLAHEANGTLLVAQVRVCVPTTMPPENARDIAISGGARISVVRRNAAGACAAPANS